MTQATLVGSVAIVFGAAPVSAQHRHVSGRGQISGHVGVGSMHSINRTGRYAVPRATLPPRVTTINSYRPIYHRPGVATPGHVWVNRYDHAEVYVDGYYAGTVDDFDGRYQELQLEPTETYIFPFGPKAMVRVRCQPPYL